MTRDRQRIESEIIIDANRLVAAIDAYDKSQGYEPIPHISPRILAAVRRVRGLSYPDSQ